MIEKIRQKTPCSGKKRTVFEIIDIDCNRKLFKNELAPYIERNKIAALPISTLRQATELQRRSGISLRGFFRDKHGLGKMVWNKKYSDWRPVKKLAEPVTTDQIVDYILDGKQSLDLCNSADMARLKKFMSVPKAKC